MIKPNSPASGDADNSAGQNRNGNCNNKKHSNKILCPYACPNCATLGEYLESRYELFNVLEDSGENIFSPMDEKYTEEHKSSIRNGQVFIAAEVVASLLRKSRHK